jgi:hypothetical protein
MKSPCTKHHRHQHYRINTPLGLSQALTLPVLARMMPVPARAAAMAMSVAREDSVQSLELELEL